MIVVQRMKGGSYMLAELDGTISKLCFAVTCVIPYYPHSEERVSVTQMTGLDEESIDQLEAEETIDFKNPKNAAVKANTPGKIGTWQEPCNRSKCTVGSCHEKCQFESW
jgi:hypothetical protein